jgi:hypothetical protein
MFSLPRALFCLAAKEAKGRKRPSARRPARFQWLNCKNSLRSGSLQFNAIFKRQVPACAANGALSGMGFYFSFAAAHEKEHGDVLP